LDVNNSWVSPGRTTQRAKWIVAMVVEERRATSCDLGDEAESRPEVVDVPDRRDRRVCAEGDLPAGHLDDEARSETLADVGDERHLAHTIDDGGTDGVAGCQRRRASVPNCGGTS
jgi:hypothetical protein